MHSLQLAFVRAMNILAAQGVDPNQGTAVAAAGAKQRLQDPTYYDAVFPFIAFFLVIVVPIAIASWVIFKTATEKTKEADEV